MDNINIFKILELYETEIRKNVKNKKRLMQFERHKMENLFLVQECMNENYQIQNYNIFLVHEPKCRVIMSMGIYDKLINHYFTRHVLIPKLEKYLDFRNIATREGMGTDYGIRLVKKYIEKMKKHGHFYVLKLDIKKYFYNIDHRKIKELVKKDLTELEYKILCHIIDSTNEEYVNQKIEKLGKKIKVELPKYYFGKGLPIGNLTSQFLSVYYLNELDHFIVYDLHLKYYVRYMDDFIIMHEDKNYLKECLNLISEKLKNEFYLEINQNKTKIYSIKQGFIFLGYRFFLKDKKTICILRNETYGKLKKNVKRIKSYLQKDFITFEQYFSSINNYLYSYKYGSKKKIENYIDSNG